MELRTEAGVGDATRFGRGRVLPEFLVAEEVVGLGSHVQNGAATYSHMDAAASGCIQPQHYPPGGGHGLHYPRCLCGCHPRM